MVANEVTKLGEKLGWMDIYRGTQQLVLKLIFGFYLFIFNHFLFSSNIVIKIDDK